MDLTTKIVKLTDWVCRGGQWMDQIFRGGAEMQVVERNYNRINGRISDGVHPLLKARVFEMFFSAGKEHVCIPLKILVES